MAYYNSVESHYRVDLYDLKGYSLGAVEGLFTLGLSTSWL